ncbi:unnamed protein product [Phytomonas sp. Hart1]|nr:unnamed protein product [Phytomonas sp. Hart1]|eukprot:CCW71755.1 unnamed protein product [Phytomonas sp. isolate Hart1]
MRNSKATAFIVSTPYGRSLGACNIFGLNTTIGRRGIILTPRRTFLHKKEGSSGFAQRHTSLGKLSFRKFPFASSRKQTIQKHGMRRDAVGMLIPEAILQAKHVSYDEFDRKVDECSREMLGLTEMISGSLRMDRVDDNKCVMGSINYGAAFDNGRITFHGSCKDARKLLETSTLSVGACDSLSSKASHGSMDKSGEHPSIMRSEPSQELKATSHKMVAYVRETHQSSEATTPSHDAKPVSARDSGIVSRCILKMDNGEEISVRRDHLAAVRRVTLGHPSSSAHNRSWFDKILSNTNKEESLLQKGCGECKEDPDADVAPLRRSQRRLKEAKKSDMKYGLTRHPCQIQGEGCHTNLKDGCVRSVFSPASPSRAPRDVVSSMCPYTQYPSVCCVDYLTYGRCIRAEMGCCPWFHGDPSLVAPQKLLAEFLLTDEGVDEDAAARVVQRLRETSPYMGLILQIIVDLITVAIEESDSYSAFFGKTESSSSTNPHRIELLRAILQARRGACLNSSDVQPKWEEGEGEVCQWLNILALPTLSHRKSQGVGGEGQRAWCLGLDLSVVKSILSSSEPEETVPLDNLDVNHDNETFPVCNNNLHTYAVPVPNTSKTNDKVDMEEIFRIWCSFFTLNMPISCTNVGDAIQKPQYLRLSPLLTQWAVDTSAELLWRTRHLAHAQMEDNVKQSDTPSQLFQSAARYLLQCRVRDCEDFNLHFSSLSRGLSLPSTAELGHLRWAPLLLLQDCVRLKHISAKDTQPHTAHDSIQNKELEDAVPLPYFFGEVGGETSAEKGDPASPLLDVSESSSGLHNKMHNSVLPATFILDTLIEEYINADWNKKNEIQKGGSGHMLYTGAVTSEFTLAWHALHAVVLKLGLGLLHCMEATAATVVFTDSQSYRQDSNPGFVAQSLLSHHGSDGSAAGFFTFVQTALLHLGLELSAALGERYERPLLDSAGWTSWTEQSMFSDEFQRSLFSAAGFARHHQPVVMLGCMNSLLNGLLLIVLQRAERMHTLHERSPIRRLLSLDSPSKTKGDKGDEATQWLEQQAEVLCRVHLRRLQSRRRIRHSLQPYIAVSFGIWSCLHDHSQRVLEAREQAMKEFHLIRAEFDAERSENAPVRTRKYGGSPVDVAKDDEDTLPIIDLLLPHGSAALSAAAISRLLVLLREGGSPYKSLRLAASIIHSARMLRHAANQPRPQCVQATKIVHRMTRSRATNRKHVTKVRVPVVKFVSSAHDETDVVGNRRGHRTLKAIGLVYALDEEVINEALRVGLFMGKAGLKLSDGIRDDCVKGALIDYAEGRCLPMPTPEIVDAYLSWRSRTELPRHAALSVAPNLLQLLGLHAHRKKERKDSLLEMDFPAYGRRIPPTALLLEILAAHTDLEDVDRHQACLSLLQQDIHRFGTAWVCFAMQYRLVCRRPALGLSIMHRLWIQAITEAHVPWELPLRKDVALISKGYGRVQSRNPRVDASEQEVLWSKLHSAAEEELTYHGGLGSTMVDKKSKARIGSNAAPATVQEIKAYLKGEGERNATSSPQLRTGQKAIPPSYENLIHQIWLFCQPNEWHRMQLVWSVCAATLLGLSSRQLEAAHENRRLAAQCLFYCFLAALPLGMNAQRDKTVQVLLFSGLFSDTDNRHVLRERGAGLSEERGVNKHGAAEKSLPLACDGMVLSSAHVPRVRGLNTFLALQLRLATELLAQCPQVGDVGAVGQEWVPAAWQVPLLMELKAFLKVYQKDIPGEVSPSSAWQLFQALLSQPSLVLAWLEQTLLCPSDALLMWLVVHLDYKDEELQALIQWLEALSKPTPTGHAVLAQCKKDHAALQHNSRRLKKGFIKPSD